MELKSSFVTPKGQVIDVVYHEDKDPLLDMEGKTMQAVHGFCFCGDKMVLVKHPTEGWMPPGGSIDEGETYEEALVREVKEETNMKVLSHELIGFQDVNDGGRVLRQTRSYCVVEPYGDFVADPDGDISEIILIDPKDYKRYFDWGVVGDRVMEQAIKKHLKCACG